MRTMEQVWADLARAERIRVSPEKIEELRAEARALLTQAQVASVIARVRRPMHAA